MLANCTTLALALVVCGGIVFCNRVAETVAKTNVVVVLCCDLTVAVDV